MADVQRREPEIFVCGDTLLFERYLRDYLPSDGWSLLYEIRGGASTTNQPITFTSTASGDFHLIQVNNFAAEANAGVYELVGYAVNGAERHQIYDGQLNLLPNGTSVDDSAPVKTHAQKMIEMLEAGLERLAAHEIDESNVERAQFIRAKRLDLEKQLAINKEIRANELKMERIRNGQHSGQFIRPRLEIVR